MFDRVLDEEIREAGRLVEQWRDLTLLVRKARAGEAGAEEAQRFSEMRRELSRSYPALLQRLEIVCGEQDDMFNFLGKLTSIDAAAALPDIQWRKVEELRGRVDVTLQGILGLLESRKKSLRRVSASGIALRKFFSSAPFKLLVLTAGILLFFLVLSRVL